MKTKILILEKTKNNDNRSAFLQGLRVQRNQRYTQKP